MSEERVEEKRRDRKFLRNFLIKVALIAVATWAIVAFLVFPKRIDGNSGYPAVRDGDLGFFVRIGEPAVGDFVAYAGIDGKTRFGRIVAEGPCEVDVREDGGYVVDGKFPDEDGFYETRRNDAADLEYPLEVEDGSYFILNDARKNLDDSRTNGTVSKGEILGTLEFLFRRRGI